MRPMSDEQPPAQPDDREPSPERQAELRAAYEANVTAGKAPYAGVRIRTRGELRWIMQECRWSGGASLPEGYERAELSGADFFRADLSGASLNGANLSGADFFQANLSGASLDRARLNQASLRDVTLSHASLYRADLSGASLYRANLSRANLKNADLNGANLESTDLNGVRLPGANLSGASLSNVNLSKASLPGAILRGATLFHADLSGADLSSTELSAANLRLARMDATTDLRSASLDERTLLADVVWNGAPLTRLNWQQMLVLGEERVARQPKDGTEKRKSGALRLEEYADAVLASRQVATVLRSQGLNEHADRFAYRAQLLQRQVLRRQGKLGRAFGSWLLDVVSGYGYNPIRSVLTYVLVVAAFAAGYFILGGVHGQTLSWNEALVVSMTAFHGRGFFGSAFQPGDPQAAIAAVEALVGLLIEITFIATFTQRFFAR
jgi:uncharacterized protein YjbI with pentapeptide repeats